MTDLPVSGYRSSASNEETVTFWADYFTHQIRGDLRPTTVVPDAATDAGMLSAARRALARDPIGMGLLPAFPDVCHRVTEAIDEGAGFERVAEIAALDGPLLTTLVHRANAAAYGSKRIESAVAALSTIGTAETKKLLLGRAMGQIVRRLQQAGFSNRDFFLHSATVGFVAQLLSCNPDDSVEVGAMPAGLPPYVADLMRTFGLWQPLACPPGYDAFAAGMLHDIGKVALASSYPDAFPQIVHEIQRRQWQQGSRGAERVVTGELNHAALGAALLENWKIFPGHIASTCRHHHVDAVSPAQTVLVSLANCLAKGIHPFPSQARLPQPQREQFLGLSEVDTSAYQQNPLVAACQTLTNAFETQRRTVRLDAGERDTEHYHPGTITVLVEQARDTVRADDRQYLGLLLNQNPEFVAVATRCGVAPEDLVALGLLLQRPITSFVADLLRLTTSADPIVRRAMAA